ncbi:MAG: ABC-ATPase domain-containing protein [Lachnospiraceae bacterium]|nr:ABC-ATPase domain-containing protein [Lachnospiraceae bacterium]
MKNKSDLRQELESINRRGYPAYKSLRGQYDFGDFVLSIDHVQGDPFASPSNLSVEIPIRRTGFPEEYRREDYARIALEDCILRRFSETLSKNSFKAKGSGKSGLLATSRPGQEILHRSALVITKDKLTARFEAGFPANGRTVNSYELEKMLFDFLPPAVMQSLYCKSWKKEVLQKNYELAVDQHFIREELPKRKLAAFLGEGSILPRMSGVSSKPLRDAVPLGVPASLKVELDLPYHGKLCGMGIPQGVTLIIGGGYHGKSTLLQALEQGVYNHIAGDGREYAVTEDTACKLRAEDGRSVRNLDLSLFIHNLPNGKDTKCFSTADASGSTSQAAAVMEGIEAGSRTFLIDEDTSATNFLVRDEFMQKIVHGDKEPITPFCARVRDLYDKAGISTVLVAGSSGAFFHVADTVIQMDAYRPLDVREKVERFLPEYPLPAFEADEFRLPGTDRAFWGKPVKQGGGSGRQGRDYGRNERSGHGGPGSDRSGNGESGHGGSDNERRSGGRGREERIKTKVMSTDGFSLNHDMVDLRYVEQLIDSEQTAALAKMMKYVLTHLSGTVSVDRLAKMLAHQIEKDGLEPFMDGCGYCGLAMPRIQEIYAMLNRYRG